MWGGIMLMRVMVMGIVVMLMVRFQGWMWRGIMAMRWVAMGVVMMVAMVRLRALYGWMWRGDMVIGMCIIMMVFMGDLMIRMLLTCRIS